MQDTDLAGFVLPWAKATHPDKYAATVAVAGVPSTFRKYLLRLVEIRCDEEKGFVRDVPMSVLNETGIKVRLRSKAADITFEVCGRNVQGRVWGFNELQKLAASDGTTEEKIAELRLICEMKSTLDLELIND